MTAPRLTDTTLRDGSHPMRHRYTADEVGDVVTALDAAGVPLIEVTHGDGLGGSSQQYGVSSTPELELIQRAAETAQRARIVVLLIPGRAPTSRRPPHTARRPPGSPRTAPRPTSPSSTSRWPPTAAWSASGSS